MEETMHYYALPVTGHLFKGNFHSMDALLAHFMRWAEKFGIDDDGSLSLWFYGSYESTASNDPVPGGYGFNSWAEIKEFAEAAMEKMPKETNYVDLTNEDWR